MDSHIDNAAKAAVRKGDRFIARHLVRIAIYAITHAAAFAAGAYFL